MVQQHQPAGDYSSILENIPTQGPVVHPAVILRRRRFVPSLRDSLTRLHKTGRPGSKRYQRFVNREYLQEQQWDLQPEDFQVVQFTRTVFSTLLHEKNRKIWEPFIDVTEEQEALMLQKICKGGPMEDSDEFGDWIFIFDENVEEVKMSVKPHVSFSKIEKRVKQYILKNPDSPFLQSMDKEIVVYIKGSTQRMSYNFENPFHRLICHGICEFYSLHSHSEDSKEGTRVLHIVKPKKGFNAPSLTLCEYLQTMPVDRM